MRTKKSWLKVITSIRGFEDPPGGDEGGNPTGQGNEGGGDGEQQQEETKPGEGETDDGEGSPNALKTALQKERENNKALNKRISAFEKAQRTKDDAEKTEVQRLTDEQARSSEKVTKLAAKFRKSAIHSAIVSAAKDAKFTDPTDAIREEVIAQLGVDQDEDDPSDVTIDAASVKKAVEELAKKKPHYLTTAEPERRQGRPSGSKFGNSGDPKPSQQDRLVAAYPALQRRG